MATHLQRLNKEQQHPSTFKAAVFPANAALEIVDVQWREPGQNELAIKVHACALSNNDAISSAALLPSSKYPRTPGMAAIGEVVVVGGGGTSHDHNGSKLSSMISKLTLGKKGHGKTVTQEGTFKVGDKVIATFTHQGLAEYCTAHVDHTTLLDSKFEPLDQLVAATAGARVLSAYNHFSEERKSKSEEERQACTRMNEEIGFGKGEGVVVVYGEGGYARMALTAISLTAPEKISDRRIVLVTPSGHFSPDDYRIPAKDMLVVGRDNIDQELKKMGGVALVVAADQPAAGFNEVVDSTRYEAQIVLLTLSGQGKIDLNVGLVLARSLTVDGAPLPTGASMRRALSFLSSHDIRKHLKLKTSDFTVDGVNEAWVLAKRRDTMLAPVVVFGYKGGQMQPAAGGGGAAAAAA